MKQKTPMMKMIEWIQSEQFNMNEGYIIRDIDLHAKATELLAEERRMIEDLYTECWMHDGAVSRYNTMMEAKQYYTQTYGGGDES